MSNWFAKNFWLKLTALILAVLTWSYAREALRNTPGYKAEKVIFTETPAEFPQR